MDSRLVFLRPLGLRLEFSPLLYLKNNYNVRNIEKLIITHPHKDHIDDIINIDELPPKSLVIPKELTESDIRKSDIRGGKDKIDKYLDVINKYSDAIKNEYCCMSPEDNDGLKISCFKPTKCSKSNINNHSIVTIMEYEGVKTIIPGDNEAPSWRELLKEEAFINEIKDTDIFIASHHGRESGCYLGLFQYFTPKIVIVSDGPESKTSVTEKYTKISSGYEVHKRSNDSIQKRYCLTTRKDGASRIVAMSFCEPRSWTRVLSS